MLAICRLHNFLIDAKDMQNIPEIGTGMGHFGSRISGGKQETGRTSRNQGGFDDQVHHQDDCWLRGPTIPGNVNEDRKTCSIRDEITTSLEAVSVKRPDHSLGRLPR